MKKSFIMAALVMVAAIFASCEKEPTALEIESLPGKVVVKGYVTLQAYEKDGTALQASDIAPVANQEIVVLRGMDTDGDAVADAFTAFKATTNEKGFYEISLPCETGKQIDEVKVQCSVTSTTAVYDKNDSEEVVSGVTADFYGEAVQAPAAEGNIYDLDVATAPKVFHGGNGYHIL